MTTPPPAPRAPAARQRLLEAEDLLVELTHDVAELALEASENKPGAEKALAAHRSKIESAERRVRELTAAAQLAARLDREAAATSAHRMRGEQMVEFSRLMILREEKMKAALEAFGAAARHLVAYARASQQAAGVVPSGARVPVMTVGLQHEHAFGYCESLIQAEIYRHIPPPGDGEAPLRLPFARHPRLGHSDPTSIRPAVDEFHDANQAIITEIEKQLAALAERELNAASREAA
jgi:hypothetical protein